MVEVVGGASEESVVVESHLGLQKAKTEGSGLQRLLIVSERNLLKLR